MFKKKCDACLWWEEKWEFGVTDRSALKVEKLL